MHHKKHIIFLFTLLSFFIFVTSCGVAGRQVDDLPSNSGEGGGSGGGSGGGDVHPISSVSCSFPEKPVDFSQTMEEVGSQKESLTCYVANESVSNFSITTLNDNLQKNPDFVIDMGTCSDNMPVGTCTATITFSPRQLASYDKKDFNTYLVYSYTNNKGGTPSVKIPLLSGPFLSLLQSPITTNLSQRMLECFISSIFSNSMLVALTSTSPDCQSSANSFWAYDISQPSTLPFQIASNLQIKDKSYGFSSSDNTIFFKTSDSTQNYFTQLSSTSNPIPVSNNIISIAADKNNTYGADLSGNISILNPNDGSVTQSKNIGNYSSLLITADIANNGNIYGIFYDNSQNIYKLCNIPSTLSSSTCSTTNSDDLKNSKIIVANNGKIIVVTTTPNGMSWLLNIVGFVNSGISIDNTIKLSTLIPADNFYNPVYDSINNMIYIVSFKNDPSFKPTYTLTAIDVNNNKQKSYSFSINEIISAPILSTGKENPGATIFVVSSFGKVYAYSKNLDLNPYYIFNDGSGTKKNYYALPISSSGEIYPKISITNTDNNLFIPSYDSNATQQQTNYLFNLNW